MQTSHHPLEGQLIALYKQKLEKLLATTDISVFQLLCHLRLAKYRTQP